MIGLDATVLVPAYAQGQPHHAVAARVIKDLAEFPAAWAIPWPCLHEFISIITNPRIFTQAASPAKAIDQLAAWCESPSLRILSADRDFHAFRSLRVSNPF